MPTDPKYIQRKLANAQGDFKAALEADHRAARRALNQPYGKAATEIKRITDQLANAAQGYDDPLDLNVLPIMRELKDVARDQLQKVARVILTEAEKAQVTGARKGYMYGWELVDGKFQRSQLLKDLDARTALIVEDYATSPGFYRTVKNYAGYHADHASTLVIDAARRGQSIDSTIAQLRRYYAGLPRADAERMVRTVQLYAARKGALAVYQENPAVSAWIWSASLDGRLCPACLAQHGKRFPLTRMMNSHYQCRCAPVPLTVMWESLGYGGGQVPYGVTGEEWLRTQPRSVGARILGQRGYDSWSSGDFALDSVVGVYLDDVYGEMIRAKPLYEILSQA